MALTSDEITICNLAMGYIGEYEVSSSSDDQYILCERYYDDAVKEVLCEHPWNEAKKRAYLIQSSTDPLFGYDYRFAVPSDCLRVVRLGDGDNDWDFWEIENGYILTDVADTPQSYTVGDDYIAGQYLTYSDVTYSIDTSFTASVWATDLAAYLTSQTGDYTVLKIEYIYNLTTISLWSPKLKDAIAQKLAVKVATGITNDPKSKIDLINEYENLTMRKARSVDAQQGRVRPIFKSRWWNTRRTYWSQT